MCKVLLKDIIIPAGTVFHPAPNHLRGFIEGTIGLTKNSVGFVYYDHPDDLTTGELDDWFGDLYTCEICSAKVRAIHGQCEQCGGRMLSQELSDGKRKWIKHTEESAGWTVSSYRMEPKP